MLWHVWQCNYEIDGDLDCSFNVLLTEIDNIFIGKMQIMSDSQFQNTSNQNQFKNNYDGKKTLSVDIK